jgi:hypothetical protein
MKTITIERLKVILSSIHHATPVSFVALTDAKAKKTANPFGQILKLTKVNAFTGTSYQNAVRRQEKREMPETPATFVAQERAWGERSAETPALVSKVDAETGKENFYLVAQIQHASKPLYLVRKASSGRLASVSKDTVAPFLPVTKEQTNQPVEKAIVWRTYALTSLTSVSVGGEKYRIRNT